MNFKQKLSYAVAGFLVGNLILALAAFGILFFPKYGWLNNDMTFAEGVRRMEAREIKEIKLKDDKIIFLDENDWESVVYPTERQVDTIIRKVPNEGVKFTVAPYTVQSNQPSPFLIYLFQVLFWLFLISPPLIVILLVIIIKKMDSKEPLK